MLSGFAGDWPTAWRSEKRQIRFGAHGVAADPNWRRLPGQQLHLSAAQGDGEKRPFAYSSNPFAPGRFAGWRRFQPEQAGFTALPVCLLLWGYDFVAEKSMQTIWGGARPYWQGGGDYHQPAGAGLCHRALSAAGPELSENLKRF